MATTVDEQFPPLGDEVPAGNGRFSRLAWLRPPKASPDGTMELADHLRELRYRVIVSLLVWLGVSIACFAVYPQLIGLATRPIQVAVQAYQASNPGQRVEMTTQGVMGGINLWMKVPFIAGLIISCPFWLWQLWLFIAPGLLANEKRLAVQFLGSSIPLFLCGVFVGYWISPKGFAAMLSLNPPGVLNLNDLNQFLGFEVRLLLVFGFSFLLPVILVTLNRLGIVKGEQLGKFRNIAIFLCFVFAAVATPSTDPLSMTMLAVPMSVLYIIAEVMSRQHDRSVAAKVAAGEIV